MQIISSKRRAFLCLLMTLAGLWATTRYPWVSLSAFLPQHTLHWKWRVTAVVAWMVGCIISRHWIAGASGGRAAGATDVTEVVRKENGDDGSFSKRAVVTCDV
mmetsp:Transcript_126759/g.247040  ORF Transcript_126759/g.247040 Transcript_126759/m.247040 type:complete len:103 (-) Transcript_126759:57-365(-)